MNPFAAKLQRLKEAQSSVEEVKQAVHESLANVAAQDAVADIHVPPQELPATDERLSDSKKLSKLINEATS
jgi:molybdopterin biosynthesis enzyme